MGIYFLTYLRRKFNPSFNKNTTASGNFSIFRVVENRLRQILSFCGINDFTNGFYCLDQQAEEGRY